MGAIKELRRNVLKQLEEALIQTSYRKEAAKNSDQTRKKNKDGKKSENLFCFNDGAGGRSAVTLGY